MVQSSERTPISVFVGLFGAIALAAAILFSIASYSITKSEEVQACEQPLVTIAQQVDAAGLEIYKFSDEEAEAMNKVFGEPPMEHDTLYLIFDAKENLGKILVVSSGCVVAGSQTLPLDMIDQASGRKRS